MRHVIRNWNAVSAHARNSGGSMHDRREGRGGCQNEQRDYLDEYHQHTEELNVEEREEEGSSEQ